MLHRLFLWHQPAFSGQFKAISLHLASISRRASVKPALKQLSKRQYTDKPADTLPPELASTIVTNYWDDIMKYSREPGLYTLGHPTEAGADATSGASAAVPTKGDENAIRKLLQATISTRREQGDILPSLLARQCCEFYEGLNMAGRAKFLKILGRDFDVNRDHVASAAEKYLSVKTAGKSDRGFLRAEENLRMTLRPLYAKFFGQINHLPGGMQFLVNMRADLLVIVDKDRNDPYLRGLNESLKRELQGWFGIGFLDLERITWNTSATILEKIVQYEKVHEVPTWRALKQRLGPGRLCYSFFHRGMPQEPLTFVQVALTKEIASNVQAILDDPCPETPNPEVAIFYSISSSQRGLSGVDLGNFLIKRVVKEMQTFLPSVKTFCTLSPIPKFRNWLETTLNQGPEGNESLLLDEEVEALRNLQTEGAHPVEVLRDILVGNDWQEDARTLQVIKPILLRLCARYLLLEKKRSFAFDPVCNFHIRNGACMHRLNWMGDSSDKGLKQSYGIMVNYNYVLPEVESNNQLYLLDGTIAVLEPVDPTLAWAVTHACGDSAGKSCVKIRRVGDVARARL